MIGMRGKVKFFPHKLRTAVADAERRVAFRQGAYVRGVAARSIKRRKRITSPPGQPPYTKTGALKRAIRFAVDSPSVIIGPTYTGIGLVGKTHEFGGVETKRRGGRQPNWQLRIGGHGPVAIKNGVVIFAKLRTPNQVTRAKRIAAAAQTVLARTKSVTRRYPARPFMGPALQVSRAKLPEFWRQSVRP